ncbi:uncharacterized protein LOC123295152 [Chrysoperla carnea]|uniref:uncharacterized protein LOC123295152 n=1 Tax=Chrysoperla carnea TaxID=189513 RepID=UPI001D083D19|nr:uncharacterized protein LOC123295152 [Chrysoperla carnea]
MSTMEKQKWIISAVTALYCLLNFTQLIMACPSSCICKWKGGKQTVECINKDLITIPDGMDQGTQVLDFSGNNLQTLQKHRFQRMDLINLQRIYLARCKIVKIDDQAFTGLTNLVELDLSENMISAVPTATFADYASLMRLSLNDNPIKIVRSYAFHDLSYLSTLELSNCEIEIVEDEAFTGLNNLEWLKLNGNRLTHIRGTEILPVSLHGIDLHHNRWICDCRLLDLHNWLLNFKIPHAVEPTCTRPPRLAGRVIKSVNLEDLACLPDISPTTLYLEIGEGKNVSLLCKVSAIPEAHVSWWFQGQLLQNDTTIAPGYHLLYYIEEGTIEKRSELFIYNTNTEDNGTFICAAENSAGKSLSNYTIRVIVKEEPVVVVVPFPIEYFVAIASGASALALLIVIGIIMAILKCRRNRQAKKKKDCGKEVALQGQQNMNKCAVLCENAEPMTEPIKLNGGVSDRQPDNNTLLYASLASGTLMIGDVSTVSVVKQYRSPPSVKNFSNEQNPDLINDTESVGKGRRREGEAEETDIGDNSGHNSYQEAMDNIIDEFEAKNANKPPSRRVQWQDTTVMYTGGIATLPRGGSHELYQHSADVHLNPGCFMDNEGYPIDYGLPKRTVLPIQPTANPAANNCFYRTLPHNRSKLNTAASPNVRYSREAEFLSRSAQPAPYEHYNPSTDVRYTAEGYPCSKPIQNVYSTNPGATQYSENGTFIPSPPEGYKSNDLPTCHSPPKENQRPPQWPPCIPPSGFEPQMQSVRPVPPTRRCSVGAQTESAEPKNETLRTHKPGIGIVNTHHVHEVLTESPDEGYVGDSNDVTEI